jgi:hypothetical protein
MGELPYVISAELEYVRADALQLGAVDAFRQSLDADLQALGKNVEWVDASTLQQGMRAMCRTTNLPIISLDQRYIAQNNADAFLGISRAVGPDLIDAGYDARQGFEPIDAQFDALGQAFAGQEILLVDDVLFTGEMVDFISRELKGRGVRVAAVACGIAIGEGAEKLAAQGIETEPVVSFDAVDDEICERDFTLLAGSGRKVLGQPRGGLYFDDVYGRPDKWASIPAWGAGGFCLRSLERNRRPLANGPIADFVGYPAADVSEAITWRLAQSGVVA